MYRVLRHPDPFRVEDENVKKQRNIVSLKQWRTRAELMGVAASQGWDTKPLNLGDVADPATFYIFEPLVSGFTACGVFDHKSLRTLMKVGTKRLARPSEIADAVGSMALDVIDENLRDAESLSILFSSSIINFANTQTAKLVTSHHKDARHFGNLIYRLPQEVIMRPMALISGQAVLPPHEVALAVVAHMMEDYKNHPDYFINVDLDAVLQKMAEQYPEILDSEA